MLAFDIFEAVTEEIEELSFAVMTSPSGVNSTHALHARYRLQLALKFRVLELSAVISVATFTTLVTAPRLLSTGL